MSWSFRHFSVLCPMLVLTLPLTRPGLAHAAQASHREPNLPFTVLVYNNADVSVKVLSKARELATQIFREAGLEMVWIQFVPEQPISQELMDQVDCVVRIFPKARGVLSASATGEALPCTLGEVACFANVFFDRVKHQSSLRSLRPEQIMAPAIAHELGHLLLGSDSHFAAGIMKAKWGPEETQKIAKGDLLFRREQAKIIKANVLYRTVNKASSPKGPKMRSGYLENTVRQNSQEIEETHIREDIIGRDHHAPDLSGTKGSKTITTGVQK